MSKNGGTQYSGGAMGRKGGPSEPPILAPARFDVPAREPAYGPMDSFNKGVAIATAQVVECRHDHVNRRQWQELSAKNKLR